MLTEQFHMDIPEAELEEARPGEDAPLQYQGSSGALLNTIIPSTFNIPEAGPVTRSLGQDSNLRTRRYPAMHSCITKATVAQPS